MCSLNTQWGLGVQDYSADVDTRFLGWSTRVTFITTIERHVPCVKCQIGWPGVYFQCKGCEVRINCRMNSTSYFSHFFTTEKGVVSSKNWYCLIAIDKKELIKCRLHDPSPMQRIQVISWIRSAGENPYRVFTLTVIATANETNKMSIGGDLGLVWTLPPAPPPPHIHACLFYWQFTIVDIAFAVRRSVASHLKLLCSRCVVCLRSFFFFFNEWQRPNQDILLPLLDVWILVSLLQTHRTVSSDLTLEVPFYFERQPFGRRHGISSPHHNTIWDYHTVRGPKTLMAAWTVAGPTTSYWLHLIVASCLSNILWFI